MIFVETLHDLFVGAGYIRRPSKGLVHWLPLGLQVLKLTEDVIRKNMLKIDANEVSLSSLSSKSLWEKTGRWENTELFKLKDKNNSSFCLAPTFEEEITWLVKNSVKSSKLFPILLFQISRKYRDELRPRGGLLRAREFTMKDLYSFDLSESDAKNTYNKVRQSYNDIMNEIGIDFVVAEADSGSIGGSLSHEYHILNEEGEDDVYKCNQCDYTSNVEKATSFPSNDDEHVQNAEVVYGITKDRSTLIACYYPPGKTLNPLLIKPIIPDLDTDDLSVKLTNDGDHMASFLTKTNDNNSDLLTHRLVRIMDPRISKTTDLPDLPGQFHRSNTSTLTDEPLVEVEDGDACPRCDNGILSSHKAIEVGHTFYLGTKYSKPFNANIQTSSGNLKTIEMGCYGIGVSRLIAAIASVKRDKFGLNWPLSIAPYQIVILKSNNKNDETTKYELNLLENLAKKDIRTIYDDRDPQLVRYGKKFKEWGLYGMPIYILFGNSYEKTGQVEIEFRDENLGGKLLSLRKNDHENEKLYESWKWNIVPENSKKYLISADKIEDFIDFVFKVSR